MARHRSPRGRQSQAGLADLDASIPEPRAPEPGTSVDGSLPLPRAAWSEDDDPADDRADESPTVSVPRAGRRRRSTRARRLPSRALTVTLVAGAVAGVIVGGTTLLGGRTSTLASPDQGQNTAQGVPAAPPAPEPAPHAPPAPPAAAPVPQAPPPAPPAAAPAPVPDQPPAAKEPKRPPEAAPKPQPNAAGGGGNKAAVPAQGSEKSLKIWLTGYSFQDNTPPGSSTVSMPVVHRKAGGTGTYADPITVAVPGSGSGAAWKGGTRFYLPTVQRYVIVEDTGASAAPSGQDGHLDMWVDGEGGSKSASDSCMDKITGTGVPAIMNPAPGKPVMAGPITSGGTCRIPGGAAASSSRSDSSSDSGKSEDD